MIAVTSGNALYLINHDGEYLGQHWFETAISSADFVDRDHVMVSTYDDEVIFVRHEPTEGIQPSIVDQIAEMLESLCAARGLTIVLVEQNLDFVASLSNRVLLIQKGEIVKSLDPGELRDADVVEEFVGVQAGS